MKAFDSPNASQQSIWRGGPEFDGRIREHSVHQMLASKAFGGGVPIWAFNYLNFGGGDVYDKGDQGARMNEPPNNS